jgi:small subunit ribosomal protein S5
MLYGEKIVRKDLRKSDFIYSRISSRRVSLTTKGGRHMSFSVMVVVGDQNGVIGFGTGNAQDAGTAEKKALQDAQGNLFKIPLKRSKSESDTRYTIFTKSSGYCSGSRVDLFPAKPGTSMACSSVVRDVCNAAGITDIVSKIHKSSNKGNVVRAVIDALVSTKTPMYYKTLLQKKVNHS